tara:strand:- start:448 stop:786 length:339 start_codon:yes stop_codon:yes gene_type:complete
MKKLVWKVIFTFDEEREYTFLDTKEMIDGINDFIDFDLYKPLTFSNFKNYHYYMSVDLPYIEQIYSIEMKEYLEEEMELYYPHKLECGEMTLWKYRKKLLDKEIKDEIEDMI